jgi:7-cyano-7-deazaguanine synthase in queuosine biosynthesis
MWNFIKSLFDSKTETTVSITSVDHRHNTEQFTVNVQELVEKVKEPVSSSNFTESELMAMTKKEQIALADELGIEVKNHWTKKNIAKAILANV